MNRRQFILSSAILMPLSLAQPVLGAGERKKEPGRQQVQIDPAAIDALNAMSRYIEGLNSFSFTTTFDFDLVALSGQSITVNGTGRYLVRRPDKLFIEIENDLYSRKYIYDGKMLTVVSPEEKYFAQVEAKPTIREMLHAAASDLSLEIPLADLFDLGTDKSPIKAIRSAFLVGKAVINGKSAQHWALRSQDRDWEIWIAEGEAPLPLRISIVDPRRPERPRYTATLSWGPSGQQIADGEFAFNPSPDMRRIDIVRVRTTGRG